MKTLFAIIAFFSFLADASSSVLLDFPHYNGRLYGSGEALLVEKNDINNLDIFPASIAGSGSRELLLGYMKWFDLLSIMRIAYGHGLGSAGVMAGAINYGALEETDNYDRYGNLLGTVRNSDLSVIMGYGIKIGNAVQLGANIKYLYMNVCGVKSGWLGAGLSGLISFGLPGINTGPERNFTFGTGLEDVNLIKARFENDASEYPVKVHTGFLYRFLKTGDIGIKAGMTHTLITAWNRHYGSAGLEFCYKDYIRIRGGYYLSGRYADRMAVGLGVGKEDLPAAGRSGMSGMAFDYGLSFSDRGNSHFLQIKLLLGPSGRASAGRREGDKKGKSAGETASVTRGKKHISIIVKDLGGASGIKKKGRITVAVLSYVPAAASEKWELLTETIPDSVSDSLNGHEFIRIVSRDELKDYLAESGIREKNGYVDKYLKKIGRDLKADVLIKGSFTEMGVILQMESEIWDVREGTAVSVIKVTGRAGVNMFDLMDETAQAIAGVLGKNRERK